MTDQRQPLTSSIPSASTNRSVRSGPVWAELPAIQISADYPLLQQSRLGLLNTLTEAETEVLRQVVAGTPNKTIARRLFISIKTVEKRRSNVMKKLCVNSLPDLMRLWFQAFPHELGLVEKNPGV